MIKRLNEKDFDLEDEELDKEISDLINWSENLDYDSYVKDWYQISTSESSANFVPKPVFMPDNWFQFSAHFKAFSTLWKSLNLKIKFDFKPGLISLITNSFLFQWIKLITELSDKNFFKLNKFIHFLVPI